MNEFDALWLLLPMVGLVWAPRTWTPGELVTATSMNTIRDHLNALRAAQSTTVTGTQNDFALDGPFVHLRCTNSSRLTMTGAQVDGGNIDGARVIVEAQNAEVVLPHENASSLAANRFSLDDSGPILLGGGQPQQKALLLYDAAVSRWRTSILGQHRIALKHFGFNSGQGNAGGGADTQLTSYDTLIPAGFLTLPGASIVVEGTFGQSATSEAKTAKLQVGSGTAVTIWAATSASPVVIHFRIVITRRASNSGAFRGVSWYAANAGAPTGYLVNAGTGTVDWSADQTLKVYAAGNTAASLFLTDYMVHAIRGLSGTTV